MEIPPVVQTETPVTSANCSMEVKTGNGLCEHGDGSPWRPLAQLRVWSLWVCCIWTQIFICRKGPNCIPEARTEVSLLSLRTQTKNKRAETFLPGPQLDSPHPEPAHFSLQGCRAGLPRADCMFVSVCVCLCVLAQPCIWAKGRALEKSLHFQLSQHSSALRES